MAQTFFAWDPKKYSVHVSSMDNEHQELIRLMNILYEKHVAKASKAELHKALNELGNYTVKHFKDEEALFDKIPGYDKAQSHKAIHASLIEKFKSHAAHFEKEGVLTEDFFNFLKVWLSAHIAGIDMKYGEAATKKAG